MRKGREVRDTDNRAGLCTRRRELDWRSGWVEEGNLAAMGVGVMFVCGEWRMESDATVLSVYVSQVLCVSMSLSNKQQAKLQAGADKQIR